MEDRIEINGVWYVKEQQDVEEKQPPNIEVVTFDGRIYETDTYRFEVSRVHDDEGKPFGDAIDIETTDKTVKPFVEDSIDNPAWLIGVLNNDRLNLAEANRMFNKEGLEEFKYVIQDLVNIGWLKN